MNLFVFDIANEALLNHSYNPWLVALSFLIAICGSVLALYVVTSSTRIQSEQTRQVILWLGASAFGLAVWSMHFIGMLALSLCAAVRYDTLLTLVSVIPAILSARLVLHYVARKDVAPRHLLVGGIISGAGIGLMHYSGMLAMQLSADLRLDFTDFALSLMATVVLATLALGAQGALIKHLKTRVQWANHLSALIMGLAITTMHYSGMAAVRFVGEAETQEPIPPGDGMYLAIMVAMAVVSILGLVASGVLFTKLKDSLTTLKVQGYELEAIIENATQGIVTILGNGRIRSVNRMFQNIFECTTEDAIRQPVSTFIPEWPQLLEQTAKHTSFETIGKRKNGAEFPLEIRLTRLQSGLLSYDVGFINDLSDTKRLQDKLLHDANHDFLTGLHNRRFMEEQLTIEFKRCDRSGAPLSLLMLDIDHFKNINDSFGHIAGDKVLATVASMLRINSRNGDILSRYGGEEFLLLLPNTDPSAAMLVAERIRSETEKLEVNSGKNIRFTVSLGVSCLQSTFAMTPKDLVRNADMALYRAKNAGRNRIEFEDSEPASDNGAPASNLASSNTLVARDNDPRENPLHA